MRTRFAWIFLISPMTIPLIASGCGSITQGPTSKILPVSGKVNLKGKMLTSGTVKFEPEDAGREAYGEIGGDGTFRLSTFTPADGVIGGLHRISVTGKGVPIKYGSAASSKIEVEVVAGKTEYMIDLP